MSDQNNKPRGDLVTGRYHHITNQLQAANLKVITALKPLQKLHEKTPVFMRTDTHWSPEGAIAVADFAIDQLGLKETNIPSPSLKKVGVKTHKGDLYNFLDLGPLHTSWF